MKFFERFGVGCLLAAFTMIILSIPAWITHIIYCLRNDEWGFLIAGAIVAPIGVIHGWLIWFGLA